MSIAWFGAILAVVLFPLFNLPLARFFRVGLEEVVFFIGPTLRQWERDGVVWRIRLIPNGSYVKYRQEEFLRIPLVPKLLIHLAPHVVITLIGMVVAVLAGGPVMWNPTPFYLAVFQGACHPLSTGPELLRSVDGFLAAHVVIGFGWVIAAMGWLNLLPIPIAAGGQAIIEVIGAWRPLRDTTRNLIMWFGLLFMLWMYVAWGIAVCVCLFGG